MSKREQVGKLLKSCGVGNKLACAAARLHVIEAGSVVTFRNVDAQDEHPNKMPFKGILLLTDQPSTKPPHGSQGHRIEVPTKVAQKKLKGLIGMAVNYDAIDLDGHSTRHKVGVITKAWIDGTKVWVEGFIYKKDFPEAVDDLKDRKDLGMSMELADVYVRDEHESVWHLLDFEFTGATILKKSAAAYYQTALAANAAANRKRSAMSEEKKKVKSVAAGGEGTNLALLTQAIGSAVQSAVKDALGEVKTSIKAMGERLDDVSSATEELHGLYVINAAGKHDDDDDDMEAHHDDDDMEAHGHSDDDDDDMEASKGKKEEDEDEDDEELEAAEEDLEEEPAEEEPGEVNKKRGDKNKGNKTTVTDPPKQGAKVPGNIAKGRLKSSGKPFPGVHASTLEAAAVRIETLSASVQKSRKIARRAMQAAAEVAAENKKMRKLVSKMEAQVERAANETNRRSVIPIEVRNLLAKGGVDVGQLQASGQKMSVEAIDAVFRAGEAQGIILEPEQRAGMKNILYQKGLLEAGEIDRGYTN